MGTEELDSLSEFAKLIQPGRIIFLIAGLFVLSFIVKFVNKSADGLQKALPSKRLLILQVSTIFTFAIYILGSIILFYSSLRPPKELILAIAGSAAVAIGFALKDLAASLISGVILLFDRPFQVGDRVQFGDIYGEIVSIGIRTVRLTTLDDNLVTIPNVKFLTEAVSSGNSGALDMMITVDFSISPDSDLRLARDLLEEVVTTSRYAYLEKPVNVVMTEISNTKESVAIQLKVKAYVIDVRYEKALQTDIVLRGNELLKENNIERPYIRHKFEAESTAT